MTTLNELATKKDVEEIVGRVVGEIVSDALQLISERFDKVDERFNKQDAEIKSAKTTLEAVQKDVLRIDNKLDVVNVVQADHGMRIKKLEPKFT